MKIRILGLLLLLGLCAKAQTVTVEGVQSGTWDADTVYVTGNVRVVDSLRVMPGTVVLFEGSYQIEVGKRASFFAEGTEADSIVFTVRDTTGFHVYNLGRGGWNGFYMEMAGKVRFDYCVLEYGKAADTTDQHGGALNIQSCDDVTLTNSTIRCNFSREFGGALNAENSIVVMKDCLVEGNKVYTEDNLYFMYGGAFRFLKCEVELSGMVFDNNEGRNCIGGALSLDSCAVMLDRSVFTNNVGINGGGLYIMRCNDKECRLSNLVFDHNVSVHFGGGLAFSDASPEVYNLLVTNNTSYGVSCSGVFFYQFSSPKLYNCIVYGNYPPDDGGVQTDTTEMWCWTYDDYGPEFRNCLIEGDTSYIRSFINVKAFEDIIDADPLFVDREHHDFHLSEGSPCRDAGNPALPDDLMAGLDVGGLPRVANQRVDIGPYEYSPAGIHETASSSAFARLIGNPLSSESRLALSLDKPSTVTVSIYALTGRRVASRSYNVSSGHDVLSLAGLVEGLASGVYAVEIVSNNQVCTLKAVK